MVPATVSIIALRAVGDRTCSGLQGAPLAQRTLAARAGSATHISEYLEFAPRGSISHHLARRPSSTKRRLASVGRDMRIRRPKSTIERWLGSMKGASDSATSSASSGDVQ